MWIDDFQYRLSTAIQPHIDLDAAKKYAFSTKNQSATKESKERKREEKQYAARTTSEYTDKKIPSILPGNIPYAESVELAKEFITTFEEASTILDDEIPMDMSESYHNSPHAKLNRLIGQLQYVHGAVKNAIITTLPFDRPEKTKFDELTKAEWIEPSVPALIMNPPPVRPNPNLMIDKTTGRVVLRPELNEKTDAYPRNFNAVALQERAKLKGANVSLTNDPTVLDTERRVLAGMWGECKAMVKLRSMPVFSFYLLTLCSYKCGVCIEKAREKKTTTNGHIDHHICAYVSPSFNALKQLLMPYYDMPFFVTSSGVEFLESSVPVSSMMPILFFQLLEQTINVSSGVISSYVESYMVSYWMNAAVDSLFGHNFRHRGFFEEVSNYISQIGELFAYKTKDLVISSITPKVRLDPEYPRPIAKDGEHQQTVKYMNAVMDLAKTHVSNKDENSLWTGDALIRWLIVMVYGFYAPISFVNTAVDLAIEQSAAGQQGSKQILQRASRIVKFNGATVAIKRKTFGESELWDKLHRIADRLTANIDLSKFDWESYFFDIQTTRSAGVQQEMQQHTFDEIASEYGEETARKFQRFTKMRMFDAAAAYTTFLRDSEEFLKMVKKAGKAGQRHQVARRPRVIIVASTALQLSGAILHKVLYSALSKDGKFTASGKQTGNIRDLNLILNLTSLMMFVGSTDVKGMDAATTLEVVDFSTQTAMRFLDRLPKDTPFFFGGQKGIDDVTSLPVYDIIDGKEVYIGHRDFNRLQWVLLATMADYDATAEFPGGLYTKEVLTSGFVFRSGWFFTSDQHTFLGVCVMHSLLDDLQGDFFSRPVNLEKYPALATYGKRLRLQASGGVMGDDQVSGLEITVPVSHQILRKLSKEFCIEAAERMRQLGFEVTPVITIAKAEFLKQNAIAGAPSMYPFRLVHGTSERGDSAGAYPDARFTIHADLLREAMSRSPHAPGITRYLWVLSILCGTFVTKFPTTYIDKRIEGKPVRRVNATNAGYLASLRKVRPHGTSKDGLCLRYWPSPYGINISVTLEGLWTCNDRFGVPFPTAISVQRIVYPSSSCYTSPTTAMTWHWLRLFTTEPSFPSHRELSQQVGESDDAYYNRLSNEFQFLGLPKTFDYKKDYQKLFRLVPYFATKVEDRLPLLSLIDHGFFVGYDQRHLFPDLRKIEDLVSHPVVEDYARKAKMMQGLAKVRKSELATHILSSHFKVDIPRGLPFGQRAEGKLRQAATEIKRSTAEFDEDVRASVISLTEYLPSLGPLMKKLIVADWHISEATGVRQSALGPQISKYGFGHCIPPHSIDAAFVEALGLPKVRDPNESEAKLMEEGNLPGDARAYVRIYSKMKTHEMKRLFVDSMRFSENQMQALDSLTANRVALADEYVASFQPRQVFGFNTHYFVGRQFFQVRVQNSTLRRALEQMGVGLLLMFPHEFLGSRYKFNLTPSARAVVAASRTVAVSTR
ncbi:putative RNA-dependent RNA polymerase [Sclerotinia sclerotiorum reovirus 1]|nr:putative RNA-dependent RNA polymerase [Sclerotinia sclerotiorum reovirus 1]